jgi:8-oxo-dGTP pyrophosphatase MutT (NUDIX family)
MDFHSSQGQDGLVVRRPLTRGLNARNADSMLDRLLQEWRDRLALLGIDPDPVHQSGAIPYAVVQGQVAFLLITSRRSGRWIFPKGDPIEGLEPWEVAADEAREEAGVEGEVDRTPVGTYRTMKTKGLRRVPVLVDLFPLRVTRQLEDWPEKRSRHRHWAILPEAKRLLSDKHLAELATRLSLRVLASDQPTKEMVTR